MIFFGYKLKVDEEGITLIDNDADLSFMTCSGIDVGDQFEAIITKEGYVCLRRREQT